MAEADFLALTNATHNALEGAQISKGAIAAAAVGAPAHSGSNNFVHAFHSLQDVSGVAGYLYNAVASFNPIVAGKGGSFTIAMRKYTENQYYAPMIAFLFGTNVATSQAYVLGLSNSAPYQFVLRKGLLADGLDPSDASVLRKSDESFSDYSLWHHLRLDVLINPNNDVRVNVYKNDLDVNDVDAPSWEAVPGMESYIDDAVGVLSGSVPLTGAKYAFFGHYNEQGAGNVSLLDQMTLGRQTSP